MLPKMFTIMHDPLVMSKGGSWSNIIICECH